jgi:hypothetical protein
MSLLGMHTLYVIIFLGIGIFTLTTFIYYIINITGSKRFSREHTRDDLDPSDVTICIPVYKEDPAIFTECITAVSSQGSKFVVVGDSSYEPYKTIVESHGGLFVHKPLREGQKKAIARSMDFVETPYVLIMDSDTILPEGAVSSMVSHFVDGVGGVGPYIGIKNTGSPVAYGAEFVERTREIVYRAMSAHGSVMHLDGPCVMYRTDLIKPFILSDDFLNFKIFGKTTQLGEDWLMALHALTSGFKLVKDYNVRVETYPQKTLKKFYKQSLRWSRSEWVRFGMEFKTGNTFRKGKFYTFELVYTYMLPFIGIAAFLLRTIPIMIVQLHHPNPTLLNLIESVAFFDNAHRGHPAGVLYDLSLMGINFTGSGIFVLTVAGKITKERLKTMAYGALAMGILFVTTVYGAFTFWKEPKWGTR